MLEGGNGNRVPYCVDTSIEWGDFIAGVCVRLDIFPPAVLMLKVDNGVAVLRVRQTLKMVKRSSSSSVFEG